MRNDVGLSIKDSEAKNTVWFCISLHQFSSCFLSTYYTLVPESTAREANEGGNEHPSKVRGH